jgi:hypothetical protein
MDTTDRSIVGVFRESSRADHAVEQLKQAGFSADQIAGSAYHPPAQELENAPRLPDASEKSRYIVAVNAAGREHEALGILMRSGANNSDLPPGMAIASGALVNEQGESEHIYPMRGATHGAAADSFFGEVRNPLQEGEIDIMDNSNFPHG